MYIRRNIAIFYYYKDALVGIYENNWICASFFWFKAFNQTTKQSIHYKIDVRC